MEIITLFVIWTILFLLIWEYKTKKNINKNNSENKIISEKIDNTDLYNQINIFKNSKQKIKKYNNLEIKNIFTYNELKLYKELNSFLYWSNYILLSKVRLADFIWMSKYSTYSQYMQIFNKINRKHIDFLIADTKWNIKLLIELDGYSHSYKSTIESDKLKNELFNELNIPLIRFKNNSFHNLNIISSYL